MLGVGGRVLGEGPRLELGPLVGGSKRGYVVWSGSVLKSRRVVGSVSRPFQAASGVPRGQRGVAGGRVGGRPNGMLLLRGFAAKFEAGAAYEFTCEA